MESLILAALSLAAGLAKSLPGLIDAAQQSGELTPEKAAAFRAQMESSFAGEAWKTDAQRA